SRGHRFLGLVWLGHHVLASAKVGSGCVSKGGGGSRTREPMAGGALTSPARTETKAGPRAPSSSTSTTVYGGSPPDGRNARSTRVKLKIVPVPASSRHSSGPVCPHARPGSGYHWKTPQSGQAGSATFPA